MRFRIGAKKGHYVREGDQPTVIDVGSATMTDQRVVSAGPLHTRQWEWAKCVSIHHEAEAPVTEIAVSSRQKTAGLAYDAEHIADIPFSLDLAHAIASGTTAELEHEFEQEASALRTPTAATSRPLPPPAQT